MKNSFKLSILALIALAVSPATQAQRGLDMFGLPRMVIIQQPVQITNGTAGATASCPWTNAPGPIDIHPFTGIGWIHTSGLTNAALGSTGQIITNLVQTGADQTNWITLTNCVVITTNTSAILTNFYYGATNLLATNAVLVPGNITTPTAATAGFATPYLAPFLFTNSASFAMTSGQDYLIGFNVDDASRYIRIIWTTGGQTITNVSFSAQFFGMPIN